MHLRGLFILHIGLACLRLLAVLDNFSYCLSDGGPDIFIRRTGHRGTARRFAESAPQDFLVTGNIIGTFDLFDLETAIFTVLWSTAFEDNHCPNRVRALGIRDIIAFDTPGWHDQIEYFLQFI